MDAQDLRHLGRALDLAEQGRGLTDPNPIVGAVVVRDGVVIGEGWHAGAGLDHAEIAAIRDAMRRQSHGAETKGPGLADTETRAACAGATMYVTLEPCCTQGRTPPCTTALIKAGLARVVAATFDPSPAVNGKGFELLRSAGVKVEVASGEVERRARRQNDSVRKSILEGLPFVTYKYALTIDGRLATDSGDSRWISSPQSRALVHLWRSWSDAVVVGGGTVAVDDPILTARGVECPRQPLRVVVDTGGALVEQSNLVRTAGEGPVLMICGDRVDDARLDELASWGIDTAVVPSADGMDPDPLAVCRLLAQRGAQSVLLEGGSRLAGAWWSAGVIDKVAAFVCPRVSAGVKGAGALYAPGAANMDDALRLREVDTISLDDDVLVVGYVRGPY